MSHFSHFPFRTLFQCWDSNASGILDKCHGVEMVPPWKSTSVYRLWAYVGIFRPHKENQAQELNGDSRSRRGQLPHPDFMQRLQPSDGISSNQLPGHWCVPQWADRKRTLTLELSVHLCSHCWDDLSLLIVCPSPACLSGCPAHLSAHSFIWIWSCLVLCSWTRLYCSGLIVCSPSPQNLCRSVTSLLVSQLRLLASLIFCTIPQPTCVTYSIWRGIRDPKFVLAECTKKSTNIWQTAATKLWYPWNRCSINPPNSIEIHKCFICISDKTCSQQK